MEKKQDRFVVDRGLTVNRSLPEIAWSASGQTVVYPPGLDGIPEGFAETLKVSVAEGPRGPYLSVSTSASGRPEAAFVALLADRLSRVEGAVRDVLTIIRRGEWHPAAMLDNRSKVESADRLEAAIRRLSSVAEPTA